MVDKARKVPAAAKNTGTTDPKGRREQIIAALYRCMAQQGYASSSLSDIAAEADMSSSHLLYYFPGKDAILAEFFRQVCDNFADSVAQLPDDPGAKLDGIVEIFLGAKRASKRERAVMLDLYGQAVQNRDLRRMNIAHDSEIKKVLVDVFDRTPRSSGTSAEDAAQSAHAMLLGLRAKSFYDPQCGPAQAQRLFRLTLYRLAGLPVPRTKRPRNP